MQIESESRSQVVGTHPNPESSSFQMQQTQETSQAPNSFKFNKFLLAKFARSNTSQLSDYLLEVQADNISLMII